MFAAVQDLVRRRDLLFLLVGRNLKIRYKNSALGFFWSLLVPLFMIVIYMVFLKLMRFNMDLPKMVTGIIVWQFLAMTVGDSLHAVVGNANLVTKSSFPRLVLPLSTVLANFINFLLSGSVLLVYLLWVQAGLGTVVLLPAALLAHLALVAGMALLLSSANVFFRDTEHIVSMLMLAWFFVSPVIYPAGLVLDNAAFSPDLKTLFFLNPMSGILSLYRMALLGEAGPGLAPLALSLSVAAAVLVAGAGVFGRLQARFGDEL